MIKTNKNLQATVIMAENKEEKKSEVLSKDQVEKINKLLSSLSDEELEETFSEKKKGGFHLENDYKGNCE